MNEKTLGELSKESTIQWRKSRAIHLRCWWRWLVSIELMVLVFRCSMRVRPFCRWWWCWCGWWLTLMLIMVNKQIRVSWRFLVHLFACQITANVWLNDSRSLLLLIGFVRLGNEKNVSKQLANVRDQSVVSQIEVKHLLVQVERIAVVDERNDVLAALVDDDRARASLARAMDFDDEPRDHHRQAFGDECCSDGHCASEISLSLDHAHGRGDLRPGRVSSVDSNRTWQVRCASASKRLVLSLLVLEVTVDENWPRHGSTWGEQPVAQEDDEVFSRERNERWSAMEGLSTYSGVAVEALLLKETRSSVFSAWEEQRSYVDCFHFSMTDR